MAVPPSIADAAQRCNPANSVLASRRGGSSDRDSGKLCIQSRRYSVVGVTVASAAAAAAAATALILTLPSGNRWCVFMSGLLMLTCCRRGSLPVTTTVRSRFASCAIYGCSIVYICNHVSSSGCTKATRFEHTHAGQKV